MIQHQMLKSRRTSVTAGTTGNDLPFVIQFSTPWTRKYAYTAVIARKKPSAARRLKEPSGGNVSIASSLLRRLTDRA